MVETSSRAPENASELRNASERALVLAGVGAGVPALTSALAGFPSVVSAERDRFAYREARRGIRANAHLLPPDARVEVVDQRVELCDLDGSLGGVPATCVVVDTFDHGVFGGRVAAVDAIAANRLATPTRVRASPGSNPRGSGEAPDRTGGGVRPPVLGRVQVAPSDGQASRTGSSATRTRFDPSRSTPARSIYRRGSETGS